VSPWENPSARAEVGDPKRRDFKRHGQTDGSRPDYGETRVGGAKASSSPSVIYA